MDDVVLLALSTSTAVTGMATSMFGAVNTFLGINDPPPPTSPSLGADLDMSDVKVTHEFEIQFERVLHTTKATKNASVKLDELIKLDKSRAHDMGRLAHFFQTVGLVCVNFLTSFATLILFL